MRKRGTKYDKHEAANSRNEHKQFHEKENLMKNYEKKIQ